MYLIRAYASEFGPGKTHHRSAHHPLETSQRTTCGIDLAGVCFEGGWKEIDCKHCQAIITGTRRVHTKAEQLGLFEAAG